MNSGAAGQPLVYILTLRCQALHHTKRMNSSSQGIISPWCFRQLEFPFDSPPISLEPFLLDSGDNVKWLGEFGRHKWCVGGWFCASSEELLVHSVSCHVSGFALASLSLPRSQVTTSNVELQPENCAWGREERVQVGLQLSAGRGAQKACHWKGTGLIQLHLAYSTKEAGQIPLYRKGGKRFMNQTEIELLRSGRSYKIFFPWPAAIPGWV